MGERGGGGNKTRDSSAESDIVWRTCCYKKKPTLLYRCPQRGRPAVLYIDCRRGRGHPGAVSTSSDPCDKSVSSPDPDILEGNLSTTLIVPHLCDFLIPIEEPQLVPQVEYPIDDLILP